MPSLSTVTELEILDTLYTADFLTRFNHNIKSIYLNNTILFIAKVIDKESYNNKKSIQTADYEVTSAHLPTMEGQKV